MALTATFAADLSQFEKALQTGIVKLQTFDRATKTAVRGLTREMESFSGQKLAAEATRMVEAVNRIGGVSKLTENELKRLTGTLNEAAAKAGRLGEALPPSIAKMRVELAKLPKPVNDSVSGFSSLGAVVGKLGPLLPIASIAGAGTALIGMGKAAFASAGEITDLANRTGLSIEAIQRMQQVANQTGTSLDAFTNASFKLGVNISEGLTKAREAVADLGLSYTDLKNQKPEEQFATVIKALEGVDSQQERNRIGVALFGRQFQEIAAAVQEGYTDIANAARISSDAQIKALDDAGDAWQQFVDDAKANIRSFLGTVVTGLQAPQDIRELTDAQREMLTEAIRNGENLISVMARIRGSVPTDIVLPGVSPDQSAAMRDYVKELQAVLAKVRELDPATKVQLDAAIRLGAAQDELTDRFSLSGEELRVYGQHVQEVAARKKEMEAASKAAAKELANFWKEVDRLNKSGLVPFEALLGKINTEIGETEFFGRSITRVWDEQARAVGVLTDKFPPFKAAVMQMRTDLPAVAADTQKWSSELGGLSQALGNLAQITGGGGTLATLIGSMNVAAQAGDGLRKGFDKLGGGTRATISDFVSLASAVAAAGASISAATNTTSKAKNVMGGVASGAAAGAAFGPYGAAAGAVIGGIIGAFRKTNQELLKHNAEIQKVRASLLETHGSLESLDVKARAVGLSFRNEWGHQGAEGLRLFNDFIKEFESRLESTNKEFQPLLQSADQLGVRLPAALLASIKHLADLGILAEDNAGLLQSLTDRAEIDWKKMQEAAERYGIDLASLGGQFQQLKFSDAAKSIINDFDLLTRGGADVGGVLFGMQDEISTLVQNAKKFGIDIPKNMQPWIEELQRAGLLVDENGDKLEGIGDLKFAAPIKTEFERITDAIEKLIDTLDRLASSLGGLPSPGLTVPGSTPGVPPGGGEGGFGLSRGGLIGRYGVEYFARGGFARGTDTVPAMLTPGEMVFSREDTKHFLRALRDGTLGASSAETYHVPVTIDGKTIADIVIRKLGNRLVVHGA